MNKFLILGCYFLVAVVFLSGCQKSKELSSDEAAQKYPSFQIMRGTNIAHWMSQSERRGDERATFFTEKDILFIDSVGFDHIR